MSELPAVDDTAPLGVDATQTTVVGRPRRGGRDGGWALKGLGRFIGGMLLLIARVGMVGLVTLFVLALVWEYSYTEPGDGFPWLMWTLWWLGTALWVLPGRRHMLTKFLVLTLAIGAVSPIILPSSKSTDHRAQRCLDACPGAGLEETRYFACAQGM